MLRTRIATGLVALPALAWLIFAAPPWAFVAVVMAVTAVGLGELGTMALADHAPAQTLSIVAGLGFAASIVLGRADLLGLALVATVVLGLLLTLADRDLAGGVARLGQALLAACYGGLLLPHAAALRFLPQGERWIFLTITCVMASDTAAYFAGRSFGRHALAPRISPSKTVEGGIGALLGGMVAGAVVWLLVGPVGLGIEGTLAFGVLAAVLGQTGDLLESLLKRAFGAKDSGWVIPGHGGVLDRTDSLVLPFVLAFQIATHVTA